MSTFTITVASAAARLGTNSVVINRWIQQGYIPTVEADRGVVIPLEPFEQICEELQEWLGEEGRANAQELEEFWQQRKKGYS